MTRWYETDEFKDDYLPWIKATAVWDNRKGKPRFDVKGMTPPHVLAKMTSYRVPCAHCGRPMQPFRQREGEKSYYVAVACKDGLSGACSKGSRASYANASLGQIVRDYNQRDGKQGGLL